MQRNVKCAGWDKPLGHLDVVTARYLRLSWDSEIPFAMGAASRTCNFTLSNAVTPVVLYADYMGALASERLILLVCMLALSMCWMPVGAIGLLVGAMICQCRR